MLVIHILMRMTPVYALSIKLQSHGVEEDAVEELSNFLTLLLFLYKLAKTTSFKSILM